MEEENPTSEFKKGEREFRLGIQAQCKALQVDYNRKGAGLV